MDKAGARGKRGRRGILAPWLERETLNAIISREWRAGATIEAIADAVNATMPTGGTWLPLQRGNISRRAHNIGLMIADRPYGKQVRPASPQALASGGPVAKAGKQPPPVLTVIAADAFRPLTVSDLEWGGEAYELWSNPDLDDAGVRWLLRSGCGGWGFYLSLDAGSGGGRLVSAWWAYVTEEIDIVDLIARAKRWFRACADRDDLASPWRDRMWILMKAKGATTHDIYEAMRRVPGGRRFAATTVRHALRREDRPSPELRAAMEAALNSLSRTEGRAA